MGTKKELKKLLERVEAIEAEIKAFKETAEKNVATISAEIEKLVAASKPPVEHKHIAKPPVKKAHEAKAVKPARRPRKPVEAPAKSIEATEKKKTVIPEPKPAESDSVKEPLKAAKTRTRKPRAVKTVENKPEKAFFVLYNCDEAKTPESLYNRNDESFRDTQIGRRGLWNKLKNEIKEGRIELLDNYPIKNVRLEIQSGNPESIGQHLKYGLIEKVVPEAE